MVGFALVLFVFPGIELPGVRVILPMGVLVTSLMTIVLVASGRIRLNDRFVFALALFATAEDLIELDFVVVRVDLNPKRKMVRQLIREFYFAQRSVREERLVIPHVKVKHAAGSGE
ncbi:MAG: hypothetical protein IH960_12375 [Chloroflexi bacterium]|nr:hypothetical protein [Chloroflexota bacterium]